MSHTLTNGRWPLPPLLKWPGGKRRLVQFILPLVPQHFRRYYEPFFGSGALFFALRPTTAHLADKNAELMLTYKQVRDNPAGVIRHLGKLANNEENYYAVRAGNPSSETKKAARLIYLSTLSFNGIHRVNLKGVFNVPYGYKTHLNPCDAQKIGAASEALKRATIKSQDFEEAVSRAREGDVVYLDPPYTTAHRSNGFVKYNARIFTWDDQKRLASVSRELARRGCFVFISNADHPSIRNLYGDFRVLEVGRFSVIAASRKFRHRITECVFYSYPQKYDARQS